ncbi:galactokinase [Granulicella cerasi]|uniref:galactokinase n=1 Tax=Granulicella cerasi TaxID=741063 RepID=UPI0021DFECD9|nr:galactokinase [Granulicella cerasi]
MSSPRVIDFTAPGRVNLIGEHTDYSGGLVLPMAIPFHTTASLSEPADDHYHFTCGMFPTKRTIARDDRSTRVGDWSDYSVGVLRELQVLGIEVPPFHLHIEGNVPLGAGLSSSASVEVATAAALLHHAGAKLPVGEIALLAQRAENRYVGSPCGIMDQFVITAARAGHALLLNTRDLEYKLLPMNTGALAACSIVVVNSGVKHTVTAGSAYAERRKEVEEGQTLLRERFGVRDLGDAEMEQLDSVRAELSPESYKRCSHIITENARVKRAAAAMLAGDAAALGQVLQEGHVSYRDLFEASCEEVDFLVEVAGQQPGCFGARLTGGGFGGCVVNLVAKDAVEDFVAAVKAAYKQHWQIDAEVYLCEASDGAVAEHPEIATEEAPR